MAALLERLAHLGLGVGAARAAAHAGRSLAERQALAAAVEAALVRIPPPARDAAPSAAA
jgi:hypothetical protein